MKKNYFFKSFLFLIPYRSSSGINRSCIVRLSLSILPLDSGLEVVITVISNSRQARSNWENWRRLQELEDQPALSVNINSETIVYHCHHCGIQGAMARDQGARMKVVKAEPKPKQERGREAKQKQPTNHVWLWLPANVQPA